MFAAARALIVTVLLHHRVGEPQHAMPALHAVGPGDDPVHQAAQAFHVHGSSLARSPAWWCHCEDAHTYSRRRIQVRVNQPQTGGR
jgi:hypothetical protein